MELSDIAIPWRTILWQQFGAAIDMLDNALRACPGELWQASLWDHPAERPEFSQFWYLAYHTLFWLDLYLSGAVEGFAPPAPFTLDELDPAGLLPERPYTKDELQAYLDYGRKKCQATIEALTGEAGQLRCRQRCRFGWGEASFLELLLYNMRHVQEHASQLSLMLGQKAGSAPHWAARARSTLPGDTYMETQPEPTLIELIRYNNWANAQVIAACQQLTPSQLATAAPGAYGAIIDTLGHIIFAEADYVGRLTGDRLQPLEGLENQPALFALDGMATFAVQVGGALLDAVQRTPPTHNVHEEEGNQTLDYQARALFIQIINHGIEHRTNITTILSSLGLTAPEVDGWGYLFSHPDRFEKKEGSR